VTWYDGDAQPATELGGSVAHRRQADTAVSGVQHTGAVVADSDLEHVGAVRAWTLDRNGDRRRRGMPDGIRHRLGRDSVRRRLDCGG
jgi:hypothetical protein